MHSWPDGSPRLLGSFSHRYFSRKILACLILSWCLGELALIHWIWFKNQVCAAGGPEQLLITVVAHDLDEGLGSSIGQDDELLGEGEMSVRQMGSLARNKDGREGR